jgi:hypothetical protein
MKLIQDFKICADEFIRQLGYDVNDMVCINLHPYTEMFRYLNNLFND